MRRIGIIILTITAACGLAATSQAFDHPPHKKSQSSGIYLRSIGPDGQVRYRYVYRGYESNFPAAAWLYYGYPHNETPIGRGF